MDPKSSDPVWLDELQTISLPELSLVCGLSTAEVAELVDYGALVPVDERHEQRFFSAACVTPLRIAGKLRVDFDLDVFTVALLLEYLNQIEALEKQVRSLQAFARHS